MLTLIKCLKILPLILLGASAACAAADPALVRQKIAAGALVLDVRTIEEFNAGHYPGATHIPVQVLRERIGELGAPGKPVVIYCRTGRRSEIARGILLEHGFTDVTNAGGLTDMPVPGN
ncbi:MAG: rhodanese-like domain-containing protein [Spirochaetes bacterium]|nr:MAG: rhodanese-like domain-containing protein [Spirochaetota bacterium]